MGDFIQGTQDRRLLLGANIVSSRADSKVVWMWFVDVVKEEKKKKTWIKLTKVHDFWLLLTAQAQMEGRTRRTDLNAVELRDKLKLRLELRFLLLRCKTGMVVLPQTLQTRSAVGTFETRELHQT